MLPPVPSLPPTTLWGHFLRCFRRDNYARLSGRSTRTEYWSFVLFACLILFVLLLLIPVAARLGGVWACAAASLLFLGFALYSAMPSLAVQVRRLHDVGWSGWWIALSFALMGAGFGILWFLFLCIAQEWYYTTETITWSAETARSFATYVELYDTPEAAALIAVLPFLNQAVNIINLLLFILTLLPSQDKENRYGHMPLS